jgi:hypothetical protein
MIDFTKFIGPCTRHVQSDEVTEILQRMRRDDIQAGIISVERGIEILQGMVKQDSSL